MKKVKLVKKNNKNKRERIDEKEIRHSKREGEGGGTHLVFLVFTGKK